MKVPETERRVLPQPQMLDTPRVSGGVPGAFGGDVSKAVENLGNAGQELSNVVAQHMEREKNWQKEIQNRNLLVEYNKTQQDALLSNDQESVGNIDGTTFNRPVGVLNRRGSLAKDVTVDFDKKMLSTRNNILGQIEDPKQRQALDLMLEHSWLGVRDNVIAHEAKEKDQLEKNELSMFISSQENLYSSTVYEKRPEVVSSVQQSIDQAVQNGLYSQAEGQVIKDRFQESLVDNDILSNPEYALGELQKGENGVYSKLGLEKRTQLINQAESRISQLADQKKESMVIAMNKRESELIDMKIGGQLTIPQVKQDRETGKISAVFADSMIKALERPVKAETKSTSFLKLANDILDPRKTEQDINLMLLSKNATGEISDEDYKTLNTYLVNTNKDTMSKILHKKSFLQRLLSWDWSPAEVQETPEEMKAIMFRDYLLRVNSGEAPDKAVSGVINEQLDRHLSKQLNTPARTYAVNPETKQRVYSEDGGTTWYDEKTKKLIE